MLQNLSLYSIFYTTAREGSISKAAQRLFISQPALSKSIKKLEDSLDVRLFLRTSRGVQLTEEGKLLYQHVEEALSSLTLAETALKKKQELGMSTLRIGVSTTLCKYLLLPCLKDYIKLHPHLKISISCQSSIQTLKLLEERKIDLGLIGKPAAFSRFSFFSLGETEDIFVATKSYLNHLSLHSQAARPSLFKNATLMLLDKENMTRQYLDDFLTRASIETSSVLEISTMDLLIECAKADLGIACVIREFVKDELAEEILVEIPLGVTIPKREIGVVCQKNPSPAVSDFTSYLLEHGTLSR